MHFTRNFVICGRCHRVIMTLKLQVRGRLWLLAWARMNVRHMNDNEEIKRNFRAARRSSLIGGFSGTMRPAHTEQWQCARPFKRALIFAIRCDLWKTFHSSFAARIYRRLWNGRVLRFIAMQSICRFFV